MNSAEKSSAGLAPGRGPWQFSLRALLLAVAAVSAILGAYAWYNSPARKVRRLIAELEDRPGGFIDLAWRGRHTKEIDADFRQLGPAAVPPLIEALDDPALHNRYLVAGTLGMLKDRRAVEPLVRLLGCDDRIDRAWAADALGEIGDPRAFEPLLRCLEDEEANVRWAGMRALGRLGDARAVDVLIACLDDEVFSIRARAAEGLGTLGDSRAVEPLIGVLERGDEDSWVRREAAEALGRLGDPRAIGPLRTAAQDDDTELRATAGRALKRLESGRPGTPSAGGGRDCRTETEYHFSGLKWTPSSLPGW